MKYNNAGNHKKRRHYKVQIIALIMLSLIFVAIIVNNLIRSSINTPYENLLTEKNTVKEYVQLPPLASVQPNVDNTRIETPENSPLQFIQTGQNIVLNYRALLENADEVYYGVYNFQTDDYFICEKSVKTPSASIIKVFIMEYAFAQVTEEDLQLDRMISGKTILSLIMDMIQKSDNNATNTLIDYFGMENLNAFFSEKGYVDTVLERKMLDNTARSSGLDNYTSLSDCMSYLKKLCTNQEEEPYRQMLNILLGQQVKTKIPLKLPAGVTVANKTGELNDVENDMGLVFSETFTIAIVVLTNKVRNAENMRSAIADFAFEAYEKMSSNKYIDG